ncbi:hypothetical protein DY000_02038648 [Brassica cretica]|uniref:Uncharacterized protein n=1 Tax=Brassica cretica TaxID=69181 RepID=A0ABQ7BHT8_BRACR|nr:hypothetical protein DY000_02038648 [Brassica cretica]
MKSSEFRRPFPTEFRRNMGRQNFPTTFRRHSDKKCNRCSRRKFVGIFRRISDDIPINSKVVGIPSVFSDEFPTISAIRIPLFSCSVSLSAASPLRLSPPPRLLSTSLSLRRSSLSTSLSLKYISPPLSLKYISRILLMGLLGLLVH